MGMTIDDEREMRANGITNVEIKHIKQLYENRLKADLKAVLVELQLEIEELDVSDVVPEYQDGADETREYIADLLQQKIDALKGEQEAADET